MHQGIGNNIARTFTGAGRADDQMMSIVFCPKDVFAMTPEDMTVFPKPFSPSQIGDGLERCVSEWL